METNARSHPRSLSSASGPVIAQSGRCAHLDSVWVAVVGFFHSFVGLVAMLSVLVDFAWLLYYPVWWVAMIAIAISVI